MQSNPETGVWTIVTVGTEKYIGKVHASVHDAAMAGSVLLDEALKLSVMDIPIRGPQGETGFQHVVQCAPMDNGLHPASLFVVPTAIRYFRDMHERCKPLVEAVVKAR